MSYKQMVGIKYSELVYDGMWFSPLREALAALLMKHKNCYRYSTFETV